MCDNKPNKSITPPRNNILEGYNQYALSIFAALTKEQQKRLLAKLKEKLTFKH
jgi:hypothetical protein